MMKMILWKCWRAFLVLAVIGGVSAAQQIVPHDWPDTVASMGCANVGHLYRFMDASGPLTDWQHNACGSVTAASLTTSGTVTYQQAGYDLTSSYGQTVNGITNGSATFAPSAKAAASVSTAGDLSFRSAGGFEVILPNLNAPTTGSNVYYSVAGKSPNISGMYNIYATNTQGWALFIYRISSTLYVDAAFSGSTGSVAAGGGQTACIAHFANSPVPALVNGYTYDIAVSWPGTAQCKDVVLYLNGAVQSAPQYTSVSNTGSFTGIYKTTVTAGGSGYLSGGSGTFAVTYTGGSCTTEPTGLANVTSGVVTSVTNSSAYLFGIGCTSPPTPVFTAGGGTGAAATAYLNTSDTTNTGYLTVGDFSTTGWVTGSSLSVAGLATYPSGITAAEAAQHFAALDWYRNYLPTKPTTPVPVIVTNDFCADIDGSQQLWVLQRLQQIGYVNVLSVTDTEGSTYGPQWVQYALARAGMGAVPVTQTTVSEGDNGYCGPALTAVTAAPALARSTYSTPIATLRQALVNSAANSVVFFDGGPPTTMANLIASPADGISSLNGEALLAAKGLAYYCQCGNGGSSGSGSTNWGLDATNTGVLLTDWPTTSLPLYGNGLTPTFANGAGSCYVYPTTSMPYNTWYNWTAGHCAAGTDTRAPWDVFPVLQWLMPSWFTVSASGTYTYTTGSNTYTWSSTTANGEYYSSAQVVSGIVMQSFIDSLEWSDPSIHSSR